MQNKFQTNYQLLDCGQEEKLEKFGDLIIRRPCPQATWQRALAPDLWANYHARYQIDGKQWEIAKPARLPNFIFNQLQLKLKFSPNRQIGVFPEQMPNWQWLQKYLADQKAPLKILNGFAYTGAASLAAASQNSLHQVTHLDAAPASLNWAKTNFRLSLPQNNNLRWITDDILTFLQREKKRQNFYDGFILDPPAFGRAKKSIWKIERDLPKLMKLLDSLLSKNPRFIILSCHHPNLSANHLAQMLQKLSNLPSGKLEKFPLIISSPKGNDLPAGECVRWQSKQN